jgi:ubiquinol-cytochrome c reductase cytochrome c1 subunit
MSDPIKETRHRIGVWVMLFLFGLLGLTYALKKEYWKDVV